MKIKKSLLSVCLSISLMFGCLVPSISVYAVGDSWSSAQSYTYFQNHFDDINTRLNGVIINQNNLERDFEDFLEEYRDNYNIPSGTSSSTWIGDNISGSYQNGSSGNSDISFSSTFRQAMRDWCDAYLQANTGFRYAYTWNAQNFLNKFDSQDKFHKFLDLLSANDDKCIYFSNINSINITDNPIQLVYSSYNPSYGNYSCSVYDNWDSTFDYQTYSWSDSANDFTVVSSGSVSRTVNLSAINPPSTSILSLSPTVMVALNTKTVILYNSFSSLQNGSEGLQDYYVTDSYNSPISGSYNTTTSNIDNTINSNNVNNYINNYYVENGNYPTPTQINVYINQHINEGGGNNNGGDDDNNGGSGNDWDFGFLSTIGQFIASLIAGIGEVIGGILEGLTSIITSFREGFPNVIGQLLEYFLPFLPEELTTMISLAIIFGILVGIIKLIRG